MSSRCAADAALTRAEFAAAMDFAASKIISSKLRLSSASYQEKYTACNTSFRQHAHTISFRLSEERIRILTFSQSYSEI
jgi:hypothetical protein